MRMPPLVFFIPFLPSILLGFFAFLPAMAFPSFYVPDYFSDGETSGRLSHVALVRRLERVRGRGVLRREAAVGAHRDDAPLGLLHRRLAERLRGRLLGV